MAIIPAKNLNTIPREKIIDCFCDALMRDIVNANALGKKQTPFILPERIFGNPTTCEVGEKIGHNWAYCPYESKEYLDEIKAAFRKAGYTISNFRGHNFDTIYW